MSESIGKGQVSLRCRLSSIELLERQEDLVKDTGTRGRLEHELEEWKAGKREEQKLLEGEVTVIGARCVRHARVIHDGEEMRLVDVEYQLDAAQVNTVRLDTGEIVTSRPAHEHELQRPLELAGREPENEATHAGSLEDEHPMLPPPAEAEEPATPPAPVVPGFEDDAPPPAASVPEEELDRSHEMDWDGVGGAGPKDD